MNKAKVVQVHDQDLKEAISNVKSGGYRRALMAAHDLSALNAIARQVTIDFQLTQEERARLLGEIESIIATAGYPA